MTPQHRQFCKASARPMKTVFCQEPGFSGDLRHFQKAGDRLKKNIVAEELTRAGTILDVVHFDRRKDGRGV